MLRRHIDVIALLLIGLGAFLVSKAPEVRAARSVRMGIYRALDVEPPFAGYFVPRFR